MKALFQVSICCLKAFTGGRSVQLIRGIGPRPGHTDYEPRNFSEGVLPSVFYLNLIDRTQKESSLRVGGGNFAARKSFYGA